MVLSESLYRIFLHAVKHQAERPLSPQIATKYVLFTLCKIKPKGREHRKSKQNMLIHAMQNQAKIALKPQIKNWLFHAMQNQAKRRLHRS
jgi:hypothetical protein